MITAVTGIVILLVVLTLCLLIARIATCALTFTGISQDLARFQARSAITGCGFTTREAERIVEHPVRRRIIMLLMLFGNGTVVLAVTALIPVVMSTGSGALGWAWVLFILAAGMFLLWAAATSKWLDRQLFKMIGWALKTFTHLDVRDYHGLLHLSAGYTVTEVAAHPGSWIVGKNLTDLRLGDEGVHVLGIRRADGTFVGTPTGRTYIRTDDTVLAYGLSERLAELGSRKAGPEGDQTHEERCQQQRGVVEQETRQDMRTGRGDTE